MQVFRGLPPSAGAPIALTIGNFDGVHRGHQAMLSRLIEAADDLALPSAVLTFDPPPREFFAQASAPPRLSSLRDKIECFRATGVARIYVGAHNPLDRSAVHPERYPLVEKMAADLGAMRWLLFEQAGSSISTPLLVVVSAWLAVIFISFGVFAPSNPTVVVALMVASLSVAGSIFLILELDQPFGGLIQIPSTPMRSALEHLGK